MSEENQPSITEILNLQNKIRNKEDELKSLNYGVESILQSYKGFVGLLNSSKNRIVSDVEKYLSKADELGRQDESELLNRNQDINNIRKNKNEERASFEKSRDKINAEIVELQRIRKDIVNKTVRFRLRKRLKNNVYQKEIFEARDPVIKITEIIKHLQSDVEEKEVEIRRCDSVIRNNDQEQRQINISLQYISNYKLIINDLTLLKVSNEELKNIKFVVVDFKLPQTNKSFQAIYNYIVNIEIDYQYFNSVLRNMDSLNNIMKNFLDDNAEIKNDFNAMLLFISEIKEILLNKHQVYDLIAIRENLKIRYDSIEIIKNELDNINSELRTKVEKHGKNTIEEFRNKQIKNIRKQFWIVLVAIAALAGIFILFNADFVIDKIEEVCCSNGGDCQIVCIMQIIISSLSIIGLILCLIKSFKISFTLFYVKTQCGELETNISASVANETVSVSDLLKKLAEKSNDITTEITRRNRCCFWNCLCKMND